MSFIKSASLILMHGIPKSVQNNDFKLLMLKRIASSQSFASKLVFPGGVLDEYDFFDGWNKIFNKQFSSAQLKSLKCENEMLIYKNSKDLSNIIPEIFYRICAIRETFEETGILLAIDRLHKPILQNEILLKDIAKNNWQQKVLKDGNLFLELFNSYNLIPDLFSLYEWAEWVTPSIYNRRFHTAFYIFINRNSMTTNINEEESNYLIWLTPREVIDNPALNKDLVPPQYLELLGMNSLSSFRDIHMEALRRQKAGGKSNLTKIIILSNGKLLVLPGDSRFPTNFDDEVDLSHLSIEDIKSDANLNRCFLKDGKLNFQFNLNKSTINII